MNNYKIVLDDDILLSFINNWLPDLKDNETFYCTLLARSKYSDTIKGERQQLKRFTSKKEYLYDKLKQLECSLGSYKSKGNPIPQEALAVYIHPNPRSFELAAKNTLKKLADVITQNYNGYNTHQIALSEIQKSCSRKVFYNFDIDDDNLTHNDIRSKLEGLINEDAYDLLKTRGGHHLIVKIPNLSKEFEKSWYNNINKLKISDRIGDLLMVIPGCTQGGFMPHIL